MRPPPPPSRRATGFVAGVVNLRRKGKGCPRGAGSAGHGGRRDPSRARQPGADRAPQRAARRPPGRAGPVRLPAQPAVPHPLRPAHGTSQRDVYFVSFLCAAAAIALLITPSAYHRLRFRQHDKERMLFTSNRLVIAGTVFLAISLVGSHLRRHRRALPLDLRRRGDGAHERLVRLVLVRAAAHSPPHRRGCRARGARRRVALRSPAGLGAAP